MFSRRIVKTDPFMEMPVSSRELYFQLCMDADDDGFVSNPKMTLRICGATSDDIRVLTSKRYLIMFDSGVVLIKHWRIHNELKRDRYKPTTHYKEKAAVLIKENGAYSLDEGVSLTLWNQGGNTLSPQDSIGKDSIGKVSKEEKAKYLKAFDEVWKVYPRKVGKQECLRWWERHYLDEKTIAKIIDAVNRYKNTKQWQAGYIPHPKTFLHQGRWDDEIVEDAAEEKQTFKSYTK